MEQRELVIIGGGPAGYVAALQAAQLGGKATIIERSELGGTCVNRGCIPTKTLLHNTELYHSIRAAEKSGITITGARLNMGTLQNHKNRIVSTMVSRLNNHIKRKKIEVIKGEARLLPRKQVKITKEKDGTLAIQADKIIIATGAQPIHLSVPGMENTGIMGTDDLLNLDTISPSMVIIGGGVIGLEMATFLSHAGCKVTVVELMAHCLFGQDGEVVNVLEDSLRKEGVEICCSASVLRVETTPEGKQVTFTGGEGEQTVSAAEIAVCVGYRPNTEGLGLEECGVETDGGMVKVNSSMETAVPGIYAAGDVTGGIMLAHTAYAEGRIAAQNALGIACEVYLESVPQCIFTSPEVASVGLTEDEAISRGYTPVIGRFPFAANGMAQVKGDTRGLVKIIADEKYRQILGVHIVGPNATGLIHEATLALRLESTAYDLQQTFHAHPTLAEALWEASLDLTGEALHS